MATKGKTSNKAATSNEDGSSAPNNAGVLFEVMPDDFKPAIKAAQGQWDSVVTKLCTKEFAGKFVTLYKAPKDEPELAYTRSKGVRKALKKLGLKGVVAVRVMEDHTALLAQGELGTPKASAAE